MAILSPGIQVKEKDFSQIIPSVSSSIGAIAGRFAKGPIEVPILISNEDELESVFGSPNDLNANEWFTAAEFLKYTNAIYVVRSANSGLTNAVSTGGSLAVFNRDAYEALSSESRDIAGEFIAKDPGTFGNSLGVVMVDAATWSEFETWNTNNKSILPGEISLTSYFNAVPGTSAYMQSKVSPEDQSSVPKNDELHILVLDVTGAITGTPYTILEKFEGMSKASDAVNYQGLSIYYVNVLNEGSKYIWWSKHPTAVTAGAGIIGFGETSFAVSAAADQSFSQLTSFINQQLSGGVAGTPSGISELKNAYDTLANKDLYSIDLIMCGAFSVGSQGELERYVLESVVHARKDCVGFISPHTTGSPIKDSPTAAASVAAFKASVNVSDDVASYGFMDTGFKYMFDRYNKKYRWVPLNGDIAGLAARTDATNDAWWSFGGYNRGGLKNVLKLSFNPKQAERDFLYPQGINPVIIDISSGPLLFGDRTMTSKPSAFDRINVRRLFILLEKAIAKAAKYMLFEFNDSFTRAQFKNMVEPFLKSIQGRRGITDFMVRADGSNNTSEVIDRNEFVAEIYIKPARSISFITLTFVATRTDVSFSTVVGA